MRGQSAKKYTNTTEEEKKKNRKREGTILVSAQTDQTFLDICIFWDFFLKRSINFTHYI